MKLQPSFQVVKNQTINLDSRWVLKVVNVVIYLKCSVNAV